jgi:hypothetical protein
MFVFAVVRNKKRSHSTAVAASLRSNKKVSSMVNKVSDKRLFSFHLDALCFGEDFGQEVLPALSWESQFFGFYELW